MYSCLSTGHMTAFPLNLSAFANFMDEQTIRSSMKIALFCHAMKKEAPKAFNSQLPLIVPKFTVN